MCSIYSLSLVNYQLGWSLWLAGNVLCPLLFHLHRQQGQKDAAADLVDRLMFIFGLQVVVAVEKCEY